MNNAPEPVGSDELNAWKRGFTPQAEISNGVGHDRPFGRSGGDPAGAIVCGELISFALEEPVRARWPEADGDCLVRLYATVFHKLLERLVGGHHAVENHFSMISSTSSRAPRWM